jgi:hypothetical protein
MAPLHAAIRCRTSVQSAPDSNPRSTASSCPFSRWIRFTSFCLSRMTCDTVYNRKTLVYPGGYRRRILRNTAQNGHGLDTPPGDFATSSLPGGPESVPFALLENIHVTDTPPPATRTALSTYLPARRAGYESLARRFVPAREQGSGPPS